MVKMEQSEILVWGIPEKYPQTQIGEVVPGTGTDRFEFRKGIQMKNAECPRVEFKKFEASKYDYYPNNGDLLLVSDRLTEVLKIHCSSDFEDFPANVFVAGKHVKGVRLINIVSSVDAVDMDQSQYEHFKGTDKIRKFSRLIFRKNALGEHKLVRANEYKAFVLVTREFALKLKDEGIRGISFSDPSEMLL